MATSLSRFVTRHRLLVYGVMFLLVAGAGSIEVLAARRVGITDWYMHLAMWTLIALYVLLTGWTFATGKKLRGWFNTVIVEALTAFWITILISKIPGERILVEGRLTMREPLSTAWVSIVLLALAAAALLLASIAGSSAKTEK